MSVQIEIDPESGSAFGVAAGNLTLGELKSGARSLWSHPGFSGSRVLWDLREASMSLSSEEVRELAEFAREGTVLRPGARMAFVVSGDLEFGLIRMWEAFRDQPGIETGVFREVEEARAWLEEPS